ncbi:MAG: DUF4129 domain-containing protein [Ignavibacteriae bacterium]|nr:DUF4129 domain-containing protein [Ignavibacteriota bacterium]MCB9214773.1 DUF4129 domain-containing protein [Ignavibacteria bacterium]
MQKGKRFLLLLLTCFVLHNSASLVAQDTTGKIEADADTTVAIQSEVDTLPEPLDFDAFIDSVAASRFVYDSSSPALRTFSSADIDSYLSDDEFDYARGAEPPTNLIEKLFNWFFNLINKVFGNKVANEILVYIFFAAALILVIWFIARSEGTGLFARKGSGKVELDFEEMPEDIHAINFDRLIAEALTAGEYRRAVRLQYLKTLRTLSERELIEWRREKTNGEYLREIQGDVLRSRFAELTLLFDYVWYGGFDINRAQYGKIGETFTSFTATVEGRG